MNYSNKRRSKNSYLEQRNFKWGWGKYYLSYPALYTHIKIIHGGIVIPGTNKHNKNKNLSVAQRNKSDNITLNKRKID